MNMVNNVPAETRAVGQQRKWNDGFACSISFIGNEYAKADESKYERDENLVARPRILSSGPAQCDDTDGGAEDDDEVATIGGMSQRQHVCCVCSTHIQSMRANFSRRLLRGVRRLRKKKTSRIATAERGRLRSGNKFVSGYWQCRWEAETHRRANASAHRWRVHRRSAALSRLR